MFAVSYAPGTKIAPESSASFNVSGSAPSEDTAVRYTITYDLVDGDNNTVYSDLTCFAYQFITNAANWSDLAYPTKNADGYQLSGSLLTMDYDASLSAGNGVTGHSTSRFGRNLQVSYPDDIVTTKADLNNISNYQLRLGNNHISSTYSMDGVYCYNNATVYDDITGGNVTVGNGNAIPCFDKATGNIINYKLVDYSLDNGATWTRGVAKTDETLNGYINQGIDVMTRTNIAFTLEEALSHNMIAAYHVENGIYQYMYLKAGNSGYGYDSVLGKISCATNVDGVYLASSKLSVGRKSSSFFKFLDYDGTTDVQPQKTPLNVCFYNSNSSAFATINLSICDAGDSDSLAAKYKEVQNYLTNYRPTDFVDYDASTATSAVYESALVGLQYGLKAQATPITVASAMALSDVTALQAKTAEVQSASGDKAFVPFSTANAGDMPISVRAYAYTKDIGGTTYYFYDEGCQFPIYSNTALKDSDVTNGKDATGNAVVKVDGTWYLKNTQAYTYKWDVATYAAPCQVRDAVKDGFYNQVQYVYRDANGNACTSREKWVCKFADTAYTRIENTDSTDNRGTYSKGIDYLSYVIYNCQQNVSSAVAQNIYDQVSSVRSGMENVDYRVAGYEKMVSLAKEAESMYYAYIYKANDADKTELATCNWDAINGTINGLVKPGETAADYAYGFKTSSSSLQIEEAIRMFNFFMDLTLERGYLGDKMEAQIAALSGSPYTSMTASYDANQNATVRTTATSCAYGAVENGTLVNKGDVVYSDASWQNYLNALAKAVDAAKLGNGSYAHKNADYYQSADKANYTLQASDVYLLKKDLQIAANDLTTAQATGMIVTGKALQMTSLEGTTGGAAPGLTVTIGDQTVTTAADGSFTLENVPEDVTSITISGASTIDRTIKIAAANAVNGVLNLGDVAIVCCDYAKDGSINAKDKSLFKAAFGATSTSSNYNIFADINGDGTINVKDKTFFMGYFGQDVTDVYAVFN